MALRIELANGQTVLVDELSGNIIGQEGPTQQSEADARIAAGLGSGGLSPSNFGVTADTEQGAGGDAPFDPATDRVTKVTRVAGGEQVTYVRGGQTFTAFIPDGGSEAGGVSPTSIYTQSQQNLRSDAQLAEQQRQFNEQFGFDKAQFNTEFPESQRQFDERLGFDREQLDVRRGETLLNLGSRPDTLIRYLFALRGQQTPQGLDTAPSLPGFGDITRTSSRNASNTTSDYSTGAAEDDPTPTFTAPPPPLVAPGSVQGSSFVGQTPRGIDNVDVQTPDGPIRTPTNYDIQNIEVPLEQFGGQLPSWLSGAVQGQPATPSPDEISAILARQQRGYEEGGVIPEPVIGVGLDSGQSYSFGEKETEVVVPKSKVSKDIFERLMDGAEEVNYSEDKTGKRSVKVKRGMNSYQDGGTIGFNPELFNPQQVRNEFGFPQIPHFTGGTSYVPSAQRLFQALPSERQLYAGYLQDEPGLQSDDVFELARRLAPKVTGLSAGRFTN